MKKSKLKKYRQCEEILLKEYGLHRKEHFITIGIYNIRIRVQEIGSGPALLFIHGGPNAGSTWLELASRLPDYRCLILDRPGCGLSDGVSYEDLSLEKLEYLIYRVIDNVLIHFNLDRVNLLASSFGGYWAIKYAVKNPEAVGRMIQEGAPALVEGSKLPDFMKAVANPFLRWLIPKLPASRSNSEKVLKEIGHSHSIDTGKIGDVFMNWYVSLCTHTDTLKNEFAAMSRLISKGTQHPEYILSDQEIAQLQMPVLWLWGKEDGFAGSEIARRIHGSVEHSQLVEFELAGHLPWLDHSQRHADLIREFLQNETKEVEIREEALKYIA